MILNIRCHTRTYTHTWLHYENFLIKLVLLVQLFPLLLHLGDACLFIEMQIDKRAASPVWILANICICFIHPKIEWLDNCSRSVLDPPPWFTGRLLRYSYDQLYWYIWFLSLYVPDGWGCQPWKIKCWKWQCHVFRQKKQYERPKIMEPRRPKFGGWMFKNQSKVCHA